MAPTRKSANVALLGRSDSTPRALLAGVARKLRAAKIAEADALEELIQLAMEREGDQPAGRADELVDAHTASVLLGMSLDWVYRNSYRLPFARRLGERSLRFSTQGIRRWLEVEGRV